MLNLFQKIKKQKAQRNLFIFFEKFNIYDILYLLMMNKFLIEYLYDNHQYIVQYYHPI